MQPYNAAPIAKDDAIKQPTLLAMTLQNVCLSSLPDGFGQGTDVLVGVEITGLKFAKRGGAPEAVPVRRTHTSTGQVAGECVQFSGLDIGVVPWRGERFNVTVYVRKLADKNGKDRAKRILGSASKAAAALGAAVPSPLEDVVFDALIAPQYDEALVFQYDLLFEDPESDTTFARVPSKKPTFLIGAQEKDGWFFTKPIELQGVVANASTGRLVRDGKPVPTPTLVLTMHAVTRNIAHRAWWFEQIKSLRSDVFRPAPDPQRLANATADLREFLTTVKGDVLTDEFHLFSSIATCSDAWRRHFEDFPGLATADTPQDQLASRRASVGTLKQGCAASMLDVETCEKDVVKRHNLELYDAEREMMCGIRATIALLEGEVDAALKLRAERIAREAAERDAEVKTAALASATKQREAFNAMLQSFGIEPETAQVTLKSYQERLADAKALEDAVERLKQALRSLVDVGVSVSVRNGRLLVNMPGDVLFESGRADLSEDGKATILKVATALRGDPALAGRHIQVEGHTDNVPLIPNERVPDNFALSFLRARSVVVLLTRGPDQGGAGFTPAQISAAAFGENDPIADNATPEGRAKNRRVALSIPVDVSAIVDLVK